MSAATVNCVQAAPAGLDAPLSGLEPDIAVGIDAELARRRSGLEMIASVNHTAAAVMSAQGSVLANKHAEGHAGRRYCGGSEHIEVIEQLASDRAREPFGAGFANGQPHSGTQANASAMRTLVKPGDTGRGLSLSAGGGLQRHPVPGP